MLYLLCESCQGQGVLQKDEFQKLVDASYFPPEQKDEISKMVSEQFADQDSICDLCDGTGYHRKYYHSQYSQERVAVLRLLDLVYMEYKDRVRVQRLLEMFRIVPLIDDVPEMTDAAKKLKAEQEQKN